MWLPDLKQHRQANKNLTVISVGNHRWKSGVLSREFIYFKTGINPTIEIIK